MEVMDLTDALSEVALQFCKGSLRYLEHLSIHGSISLITDTSTNIGFFTRKIPEKNSKCGFPKVVFRLAPSQ